MPKQLVAADVHVADYQKLIDQLGDQYQFLVLTAESDALTQLADFVSTNPGFAAIHLISHGASGEIQLGSQTISGANVGRYAEQLSHIGAGVTPGGDFLLYGCDVAQRGSGQQFITNLAQLTRLDVAASTNKTGGKGDWVLEATTGSIQLALPELSYDGSLVVSAPTVAWTRLIGSSGNDLGSALTVGLDGSVFVAGWTDSPALDGQPNAGGMYDAFVTKFAANGDKQWTKVLGSSGAEQAFTLTTGVDGSIYVAGQTGSPTLDGQTNAGLSDAFLAKYATDGTKVWTRLLGSIGNAEGFALTTGLDGSIYVGGRAARALVGQTPTGEDDGFLAKFSPDGINIWTNLIGTTSLDRVSGLATGLDGSIYAAGYTQGPLDGQVKAGPTDAFVTKIMPNGSKVWTKLIGSTSQNSEWIGTALTASPDGSIYLGGYCTDGGTPSGFVMKFAPDGSSAWTRLIELPGGDRVLGLATDFDGAIYVHGYMEGTHDGQITLGDRFVIKLAPDGNKIWTKFTGTGYGDGFALGTGSDGSVSVVGSASEALNGQSNQGRWDAFVIKLYAEDSTPPTIVILSDKSSLSANQTATLTFTLSESVSDFVLDDITVSGGTLSKFSGSGTSYSATFTPTANSTTPGVVSVGNSKFSDAAGNFNVDGSDSNNTVTMAVNTVPADTIPPTIAISSNQSSLTVGQTATLTFAVSESVSDFVVGDITVSGGTLSNFSGSGTSYSATFTPTANSKANGVVSVSSSKFSDGAGNFNLDGSDANNTVSMSVNTVQTPTVGWIRLFGESYYDIPNSVAIGPDGAIYVAGYTDSRTLDGQTSHGSRDGFITRYNSDGIKVWTRLVGGSGGDYQFSVTAGVDGRCITALAQRRTPRQPC